MFHSPEQHRPSKLERVAAENSAAFGGADLGELNVLVRDALHNASSKHMAPAAPTSARPLSKLERTRLEAESVWGASELAAVDFKPTLSRVEKAKIEFKAAQERNAEASAASAAQQAVYEEQQRYEERLAEEARRKRDADREFRRLQKLRKEEELQRKREQVAAQRERSKLAPFVAQKQDQKLARATNKAADAVPVVAVPATEKAAETAVPAIAAVTCAEQIKEAAVTVDARGEQTKEVASFEPAAAMAVEAMVVAVADAAPECVAAQASPTAVESPAALEASPQFEVPSPSLPREVLEQEDDDNDEDESSTDAATPQREFRTAPGTPMAGVDAADTDMDLSLMLENISMGNLSGLSADMTPSVSQCRDEEQHEEELVATLPKHKTPLHRLPYHERVVEAGMKDVLQELAQEDVSRADAALESMRESLNGYTVKELKDELRERGLKVSGKKSELVDRLLEWHRDNGHSRGSCALM